jgi:STE24 endopeptidase
MPQVMLCALCLLMSAPETGVAAAKSSTPRPPIVDESTPVPVPEPTPLAVQFHRSGNVLWIFARLWDIAVPLVLLVTGLSAKMREFARRIGKLWYFTIGIYAVLFLLVLFLVDLPLRYYAGIVRAHAYGLSNQSFGRWFGNSLKGLGVDMVGVFLFAWVPFFVIRWLPKSWWLVTGLLMVPFLAFQVLIEPIWIDPLFNEFSQLSESRPTDAARPGVDRKALERAILALAERSGISADKVYVVNKSVDTSTVNAYVVGLLGTHRIVLWDTILDKLDEREILSIMGHEMGHYVLGHVVWTILMSSFVLVAGLFWTDRAGRWVIARYRDRLGFDSLADVAAAPLLLVLMGISSIALAPPSLAYSRFHEHEADRFSLDLTHMNRSTALAFVDIQRENLAIPRPALVYKLWRSTHPSIAERIDFCNDYRPWETRVNPAKSPRP